MTERELDVSIYDLRSLFIYSCVIAVILGAVMGSFLHCIGWRIAHEEPFWKGRSHCPKCGHTLSPGELIPIFSWLFQKGKCRNCRAPIPVRYPLSELLFAVITLLCLLKFDLSVVCLRNWIFFCCLFCLSVVDLEIFIIPDGCLVVSVLAWVAALPFLFPGWKETGMHILAGLAVGGGLLAISLLMDHIMKKDTMGGGDIKLFAVSGLYLGMLPSLFALILSCVFGLVFVVIQGRFVKNEDGHLPFGPSIAAATWFMLMYGSGLTDWYMSLF